MGQMVFDVAFGKAQHLSELMRRQPGTGQEIDHALSRGAIGSRHSASMLRESGTAMQNVFLDGTKGLNGRPAFCEHRPEPRGGRP